MKAALAVFLQAFMSLVLFCAVARGQGAWPPHDPAEEAAPVEITVSWASGLRDVATFEELQSKFGAKGRIETVVDTGDAPHAVYHWTGRDGHGQATALLYPSGDFGLTITPAEGLTIRMNNFGAFFCPDCTPPVQACGRHPSWVPHWIHWDNFDCPCTVTGPHTEGVCEGH